MFRGKKIVLFPMFYMAFVFALSSIPGDGTGDLSFIQNINPGVQNLLHIPLFGVLTLLWFLALLEYELEGFRALCWACFITIIYGGLDEMHQAFVPGRYPGLGDVFLNCIGVLLVFLYIHYFRTRNPRQAG